MGFLVSKAYLGLIFRRFYYLYIKFSVYFSFSLKTKSPNPKLEVSSINGYAVNIRQQGSYGDIGGWQLARKMCDFLHISEIFCISCVHLFIENYIKMRPIYSKLLKNKQIAKNQCGQAVGQWCGSRGTKYAIFLIRGL